MAEWPLGFDKLWPHPVDGAVDRGSPDAEQFGEFGLGELPESCSSSRCLAWCGFSFGCLPRSRPLAFATFIPSRVRILIRSDSNLSAGLSD